MQIIGTANNGEFALASIEAYNPDIVLLDIIMPYLDGIGVLEKLAGAKFRPKIIMMTSYGLDEDTQGLKALR